MGPPVVKPSTQTLIKAVEPSHALKTQLQKPPLAQAKTKAPDSFFEPCTFQTKAGTLRQQQEQKQEEGLWRLWVITTSQAGEWEDKKTLCRKMNMSDVIYMSFR